MQYIIEIDDIEYDISEYIDHIKWGISENTEACIVYLHTYIHPYSIFGNYIWPENDDHVQLLPKHIIVSVDYSYIPDYI